MTYVITVSDVCLCVCVVYVVCVVCVRKAWLAFGGGKGWLSVCLCVWGGEGCKGSNRRGTHTNLQRQERIVGLNVCVCCVQGGEWEGAKGRY